MTIVSLSCFRYTIYLSLTFLFMFFACTVYYYSLNLKASYIAVKVYILLNYFINSLGIEPMTLALLTQCCLLFELQEYSQYLKGLFVPENPPFTSSTCLFCLWVPVRTDLSLSLIFLCVWLAITDFNWIGGPGLSPSPPFLSHLQLCRVLKWRAQIRVHKDAYIHIWVYLFETTWRCMRNILLGGLGFNCLLVRAFKRLCSNPKGTFLSIHCIF